MNWYVVYTKSNTEKRVAESLRNRDIEVFCPVRKVKRTWSDRVKIVEEPLFRSYCFVHLDETARSSVFGVPGLVCYLHWLKKPAIVRDQEIEVIKRMLNDFDHASIKVQTFTVSETVKIDSGVFIDQEGQIVSTQGKRLVLHLESLGISISVDTSKTLISKSSTI